MGGGPGVGGGPTADAACHSAVLLPTVFPVQVRVRGERRGRRPLQSGVPELWLAPLDPPGVSVCTATRRAGRDTRPPPRLQ